MKKLWVDCMCLRFSEKFLLYSWQKMHIFLFFLNTLIFGFVFSWDLIMFGLCFLLSTCWLKVFTDAKFFLNKEIVTRIHHIWIQHPALARPLLSWPWTVRDSQVPIWPSSSSGCSDGGQICNALCVSPPPQSSFGRWGTSIMRMQGYALPSPI